MKIFLAFLFSLIASVAQAQVVHDYNPPALNSSLTVQRNDLNAEYDGINADKQAIDATLTSMGLLGTAADRMIYTTGVDTWAETVLSSYARGFLDDANEATLKATLNMEAGVDFQAFGNFSNLALTGDVTSSGLATTVAANAVALTTDTTGNYALGDAEGGAATTGDSATAFFSAGSIEDARLTLKTESFCVASSDETSALTTGTNKVTFRMPYAFTVTSVKASVGTAPTGATFIYDINEGGTTILSTKLSIDISEETSVTAASAAVISDAALAADAEMTLDHDQVGSTVAGAGAKVCIIGHQ